MSWFSKRQRHSYGGERKGKEAAQVPVAAKGEEELAATISTLPPTANTATPPTTASRQVLLTSDNFGARNPLDWESMPLSLQMKFPHWKEQTFPSPSIGRKEASERDLPSPPAKKSGPVPENTIPYIVMERDTLASIALKFDTTTSEITKANTKLGGACPIYPGVLLYIPDSSVINAAASSNDTVSDEKTDTAKVDEVTSTSVTEEEEEKEVKEEKKNSEEDDDLRDTDLYIEVPSKFMSDQHCVQGTLFANSQSVMFRPSPDDPLVEDNGLVNYEVLIPLSEIVYAYISTSFSSPSLSQATSPAHTSFEAPPTSSSPIQTTLLSPPLSSDSPLSPPSSSERNHLECLNNDADDANEIQKDAHLDSNGSETFQQDKEIVADDSDIVSEGETAARVRSDTLNSDSLFQEKCDEEEGDKGLAMDEGQFGDEPVSTARVWSFLYIRVSQTSQQNNTSLPIIGIEIPLTREQSNRSLDIQTVRTWFVFAFPTNRLKDLFDFLFTNHPSSSSDANIASLTDLEDSTQLTDNNRLEIINLKGQYSDDSLQMNEGHYASSWEIFSVRDIQPSRIDCMDVENNLPLPHLLEDSDILSTKHLRKLTLNLVSNAVGHDWYLVYSTFKHGISLQTLYRNMINFEESPSVLLVKDEFGKLFGAMLSCPVRRSERFYGTGESLLFSFDEDEEISIYRWTGTNDYIIKGSVDSVAIGSGDGHFGLWLDEDLLNGSSLKCSTFDNEPLASKENFKIIGVEVWGFT